MFPGSRSAILLLALSAASVQGHELSLASPCEKSAPSALVPFKEVADAYVFVDLTGETPRIWVHRGAPGAVLDPLKRGCDGRNVLEALEAVRKLGSPTTEARLILRRKRVIDVFAFFPGNSDVPSFTLTIEEASRPTEFLRGLKSLVEAAIRKEEGRPVRVVHDQYQLVYERAYATLSMKGKAAEAKASDLVKLVTGPPEHWTWSANLPLNSVTQLKFNSDTRQLQSRETPKEFLAGLDLYRGDVLTTYPRSDWNRVHVKGLVRFSRTPLDSVGLAVACRTAWADLFAGPLWINEDASDGTRKRYRMRWRVGVGFDVRVVAQWVK
jgi:hypothetical protein